MVRDDLIQCSAEAPNPLVVAPARNRRHVRPGWNLRADEPKPWRNSTDRGGREWRLSPCSAVIIRMTRASLLEVFREDYIRTARSKGLAETAILFRHALRSGAIPILTVIGFLAAALITGTVVTETVFTIPGLGRLVADAVQTRDFPIVQSLLMLLASVYVFVNLIVDISYVVVDPRVRL